MGIMSKLNIFGKDVEVNGDKDDVANIKDAMIEAKKERAEERGSASVVGQHTEESDVDKVKNVHVKIRNRHKENMQAFFAQQERKKKISK